MDKKSLATISILIKDRQNHSSEVNRILTENGHLILARLGVNLQHHCIGTVAKYHFDYKSKKLLTN